MITSQNINLNYKDRFLADKLSTLTQHFSVVVVSGARQVGKSTLIQEHFSDWECVVFDPVMDIGNARTDPERFLRNHPAPLVLDEIRKLLSPMGQKTQLYHWRLHSGSEVDLIIEQDATLYPVEVKLNSRSKPKDARGFTSLRENYPHARIAPGLILAPAEQDEQVTDSDFIVPWDLQ